MTIKEIDTFFLSLERSSEDNTTLMYTRQGDSRNNPKPFVVFISEDNNMDAPTKDIARFTNVYEVMDFVKEYLEKHPQTGYFYA